MDSRIFHRIVRWRAKRPPLFLTFFAIGGACILAVTLVLYLFFAHFTADVVAERATQSLQAAASMFGSLHQSNFPSFVLLKQDPDISMYFNEPNMGKEAIVRTLGVIDNALSASDIVHSIYLYSSTRGVLSTRQGWEPMSGSSDPGLTELIKTARVTSLGRYLPRQVHFNGDDHATNVLTVIFGVVPRDGSGMRKAVVVNVNADRLRAILSPPHSRAERAGADLIILSSGGIILSHPDMGLFGLPALAERRLPALAGWDTETLHRETTSDGQKWLVVGLASPDIGLRFISLTPENRLLEPLVLVRNSIFGAVGGGLFMLTGLTFLASRRLNRRMERAQTAGAYVSGHLDLSEAQRLLPGTALLGSNGPWWACLLKLCHLPINDQRYEMASELIRSIANPALGYSTPSGAIFLLYDSRVSPKEQVFPVFQERLARELSASCTLLIDPHPRGLMELPQSYAQLTAQGPAHFRGLPGSCGFLEPDLTPMAYAVELNDRDLAAFGAALAGENLEAALRVLDDLLKPLNLKGSSEESFRILLALLAQYTLRVFAHDAEALLPGGEPGFRQALAEIESLDETRKLFRQVCQAIQKRSALRAGSHQRELVTQVKQVIATRLGDLSLGTAALAEAVGLSPQYLRELFRRLENQSVSQYLGEARLSEAKRLLQETEQSIHGICDSAGFINYSYFFTYFKKATGLTPSEYRDSTRP